MSENIAAAIAAKNEVIEQQGEALDAILTALQSKAAGGTDDVWELINEITIAEDAEESNRLSFTKDSDGNSFELKKAMILYSFPIYTGTSSIPNFSFASINNIQAGVKAGVPLAYTSAWSLPSTAKIRGGVYIVDASQPVWYERTIRNDAVGEVTTVLRRAIVCTWNQSNCHDWFAVPNQVGTITEIGGTSMLIYPGCWIALYGVRK